MKARAAPPPRDALDGHTRCASCSAPARGIDPQRNCDACVAAGAPSRVPWAQVKPANSPTCGEQVAQLANAGLVDAPPQAQPHAAFVAPTEGDLEAFTPDDPKGEVGSFE